MFHNLWGATHDRRDDLSISIFRRFSLFQEDMDKQKGSGGAGFQSPFSGDFLCFRSCKDDRRWVFLHRNTLSISIFRRFSLFQLQDIADVKAVCATFNLHFQEIFFVSKINRENTSLSKRIFQSPFSGDFLCFVLSGGTGIIACDDFQSPFSGDFLCFR